MQVVHHNNEHWRSLNNVAPTSLQRILAAHILHHLLRAQPHSFPALHIYLPPSIHTLPARLPRRPTASASESVSSDFPRGTGYADQHDVVGVCAGLGRGSGYFCMGVVVV